MIILFKYCVEVENCKSFKGFRSFYLNIVLTWKIVRVSKVSVKKNDHDEFKFKLDLLER